MKKMSLRIGLVFALFIVLNSFLIVNSTTAKVQQTEPVVITINAISGTKYDTTLVNLDKNTQYNITFVNNLVGESHNLVIVKPDTFATGDTVDSVEKVTTIGPEPTDFNQAGPNSWSYLWTTPNEDVWVMYGCSFVGHFATMQGWFKVGSPDAGAKPGAASPGFELIIGIVAVLGLASLRLRRK
jgi:bacteriorhodopsin